MIRNLSERKNIQYIIPVLAILSFTLSCIIISAKKYYWNDEFYSYYLLSDHSFWHMLSAFSDKINTAPPLYFILGWIWEKIFGSSELSLRLMSSIGISSGFLILWIMLRRTFDFFSVSLATLYVFCLSEVILDQNSEARMYGLYLLISSIVLILFDSVTKNQTISKSKYIYIFIAHSALVLTHIVGIIYSASILLSLVVYDHIYNKCRYRLYLTIFCSWLTLIPYIPSFIIQSDAYYPRGWIPIPTIGDLNYFYKLYSVQFSIYVIASITFVLLFRLLYIFNKINKDSNFSKDNKSIKSEFPFLILVILFQIVPLIIWILSNIIKPFFWDKYMIPTIVSWCLLFAIFLSKFIPLIFRMIEDLSKKLKITGYIMKIAIITFFFILNGILLIKPVIYAMNYPVEVFPGSNDNKFGYRELPIVTQFSHDFLKRFHYSSVHNRYYFILDWQAASDIESGLFSIQEYKHLEAIKRNFPDIFSNNIVSSDEFLYKYKRFLVLDYIEYDKRCGIKSSLDNFHCPGWLELRILNKSNYRVTPLGILNGKQLLLVDQHCRTALSKRKESNNFEICN